MQKIGTNKEKSITFIFRIHTGTDINARQGMFIGRDGYLCSFKDYNEGEKKRDWSSSSYFPQKNRKLLLKSKQKNTAVLIPTLSYSRHKGNDAFLPLNFLHHATIKGET